MLQFCQSNGKYWTWSDGTKGNGSWRRSSTRIQLIKTLEGGRTGKNVDIIQLNKILTENHSDVSKYQPQNRDLARNPIISCFFRLKNMCENIMRKLTPFLQKVTTHAIVWIKKQKAVIHFLFRASLTTWHILLKDSTSEISVLLVLFTCCAHYEGHLPSLCWVPGSLHLLCSL